MLPVVACLGCKGAGAMQPALIRGRGGPYARTTHFRAPTGSATIQQGSHGMHCMLLISDAHH